MSKMFNMATAAFAYLCIGTVIALAVGIGAMSVNGMLAPERIAGVMAALYGIDAHAEAEKLKPSDEKKSGEEPPSPEDVAAARLTKLLDLDLREQSLAKALVEMRGLQASLRTERERFDQQYQSFKSELDRMRQQTGDEAIAEVQRTLEALDPKQSKDQLLRILDDNTVTPEFAMRRVVSIVKSMAMEKRKKILAEFKSAEEGDKLAAILKQIGDGAPETAMLDAASKKLEEAAPSQK